MENLVEKSIKIIKNNQSEYGSFVASPSFPTYHFSWLRDGSFIAYSMDLMGQYAEAEKFYRWVNEVIIRYSYKVDKIIEKIKNGNKLEPNDFLYARYTLEGYEEKDSGWGNFQLDGYGTWLWGLSEHIKITGKTELINDFFKSIDITIKYIDNLWYYPNFDVWEENSDKIHTSTLACLYGGLNSINKYLNDDKVKELANKIKTYILTNCVVENSFVKYVGSNSVDSSLIWLAIPFEVVDVNDEIFLNTIKRIEKELLHNGGMHRYRKDTYYGGGQWILLSAWMGLYYCKSGDYKKAEEVKKWIEEQADENGYLPEQVPYHLNNEVYYPYWVNKWGNIAKPLLWSHAMYLVLDYELKKAGVQLED
ncbi:MAG: Glycoside hydrolase 15-related [Caldanaerobacter subterraneus]|uniref:Glycoside hydrolase 15-related n=3 Tax=Thermoanaerobacteraceae TaxID=186814 RepID=B0KBZ8_THEP3|nr:MULTISPECIES: glycoside hydrolase family 15 protein [Thermoanaerobacteraceae]ABY93934.1 glycoside hydrolase 15-related [Thermoanaerobacter pseudethanolicus ATCC 33223]ADV78895.1 glycoside hydrolase 15-related protein [Thermoanaerobacter brockii subsp. finnii Ako-1]KUK09291.1 MAG: Glycoside hydrolase 15-related [Caldanaerobacter subterraneus]HBT48927.1 glycoside hydrolase [Caldanaerobacter subterraneus]HBW60443.1 glycoside hydrolase [Thermoanaerobacter sp.]